MLGSARPRRRVEASLVACYIPDHLRSMFTVINILSWYVCNSADKRHVLIATAEAHISFHGVLKHDISEQRRYRPFINIRRCRVSPSTRVAFYVLYR